MEEIDFLMRLESGGLSVHEGALGIAAQLDEWLHTPVGSIYGNPFWGNRFTRYKHETTDTSMAVIIENEMLCDLRRDLPQIPLAGIRCEPASAQDYKVTFLFEGGEQHSGEVKTQ